MLSTAANPERAAAEQHSRRRCQSQAACFSLRWACLPCCRVGGQDQQRAERTDRDCNIECAHLVDGVRPIDVTHLPQSSAPGSTRGLNCRPALTTNTRQNRGLTAGLDLPPGRNRLQLTVCVGRWHPFIQLIEEPSNGEQGELECV